MRVAALCPAPSEIKTQTPTTRRGSLTRTALRAGTRELLTQLQAPDVSLLASAGPAPEISSDFKLPRGACVILTSLFGK